MTSEQPVDGIDLTRAELLALRVRRGHRRGRIPVRSAGQFTTRRASRGMEYDETRIYQAGDDLRDMDWRVTARTGKPHTKLFREEREHAVIVACDLGIGMRFATRQALKSVMAARAAAVLAWSAVERGDRLGGTVFSGAQHEDLAPRARAHAALALLNSLVAVHASAPDGENGLSAAVTRMTRIARPGADVYILSDFTNWNTELSRALARIARHTRLVTIMVNDPLEISLPEPGRYVFTDGARRVRFDAGTVRDIAAYRAHRSAWFGRRKAQLEHAGARCIRLLTNGNPVEVLGESPRRVRPASAAQA